jgi:hypothetical protein
VTAPKADAPRPRRASYVLHVVSVPDRGPEGGEPFPAGQLRLIRMMDEVLELFDTEPRFQHFTLGETHSLEEYLSIRPEHFERIESAVQEGKLLVGPWFVQPNIVSGNPEPPIRNLMIGLRTARVFGPPMLVGYVADSCNTSGWLPQILKGFGIEVAVISSQDSPGLPREFIWQGNDGSKIVASRFPAVTAEDSIQSLREKLAPYCDSGHLLLPFRWNAGASVPAAISAVQVEVRDDIFHSTPAAYAKALKTYAQANPLPVIHPSGESPPDTDTSQRALTDLIEPFCVWAEYAGQYDDFIERPHRLLERLWRDVLVDSKPDSLKASEARREQVAQYGILAGKIFEAPELTRPDSSYIGHVASSSVPEFVITAAKLPHDAERSGMIVRGYNTSDEPVWITLTPWRAFVTVDVVTLDESPTGGRLVVEPDGAIQFRAAPYRLLTFWFHD